jgi:succinate dehydrogenase/fumarate reductase flavoprotein subunit
VFGWRAGTKAAEVARDRPHAELHPDDYERLLGQRLARQREAAGTTRPHVLHGALKQAMWELLLVDKDAAQLARAQAIIDEQRKTLHDDLRIAEPFDHVLALEQRNLLDVAEVITAAAALRTESRGSHYRSDFPERDDARWLVNIFASRDGDGRLALRKQWINEDAGWEDQGRIRIMPWG